MSTRLCSFPAVATLLLFLLGQSLFAQTTRKVLFLGNSYTAFNNLPQLVGNVAASAGDTLDHDSHTPGGYTFGAHNADPTSNAKIMAGGWDYVVLQGQSQESITDPANFFDRGHDLSDKVKDASPCATVMTYMTWGRKNGNAGLCATFPSTCNYALMDTTIRHNYLTLTEELKAEVAPVSVVWHYLRNNHPDIELYTADGSHPSVAGSYAAACCFYSTIFKKDPTLITFDNGLDAADAEAIRQAAKTEVFDRLSDWDFKEGPEADFWFTKGGGVNQVLFFPVRLAESYLWDFGDGSTSTTAYPNHSYASDGSYTVSLTTSTCGVDGLQSSTSDTTIQFCAHSPTIFTDSAFLCRQDTLRTQPADAYQWYKFNGPPTPLPETGPFIANFFLKYNIVGFAVASTVNGCTESSPMFGANPTKTGYFFEVGPDGDPCAGDTVLFKVQYAFADSGTAVTGQETILWFKDGVLLPEYNNQDSLLITTGGSYQCKVVNPQSICPTDTTYRLVEYASCGVSGLEEARESQSWKLFPNPATERVTVALPTGSSTDLVRFYTVQGRLAKTATVTANRAIHVADLPAGFYVVRLQSRPHEAVKFIKR